MNSILAFLRYLRLKFLVSILRLLVKLIAPLPKPKPDAVLRLPSREKGYTIKAHLYKPPTQGKENPCPYPVLINFYGSGLAMPLHGADDYFCRQVATAAGYAVLDVEYRLAPEYPFPAAVNDAEDATKYVLSRPEEYRASAVSVSGFSSGATLALITPTLFPRDTFRSVAAFYPATNLAVDPSQRKMLVEGAKRRSAFWTRIFREGYIGDKDPRDPRISPAFADTSSYPANVIIFTGELDTSAVEAEELAEKARTEGQASGRNVVTRRIKGLGHAFDKRNKNEASVKARDDTYGLVVETLRKIAA